MEYILSRSGGSALGRVHELKRKRFGRTFQESTDLDSLGAVLESYGRGLEPEVGQQPNEKAVTGERAGGASGKAR